MKFVSLDLKDIIWSKVVLKTNSKHKLYLNTVGNRLTAPNINDDRVANLFFAVETKENPVQIATVEGAVIGGLQAAQALWARNPSSDNNRNNPIVPIMPKAYTQAELWAMKIALTPWAVAAKFWSDAEAAYPAISPRGQSGPDPSGRSMVRQPDSLWRRQCAGAVGHTVGDRAILVWGRCYQVVARRYYSIEQPIVTAGEVPPWRGRTATMISGARSPRHRSSERGQDRRPRDNRPDSVRPPDPGPRSPR